MKQQETITSNNAAPAEWESPVLEEIDVALITENGGGAAFDGAGFS